MEQSNNKLILPVAIIIAGALIAFAIYATNKTDVTATPQADNPLGSENITLRPVSESDHILGSGSAPIIFVEYSDTECPFCKRFHETMKRVVDTYGKDGQVAWVYRNFPIVQLHAKAPKEAEALECAAELGGQTGFWKYTDRIYEITPANDGLNASELPKIAEFVGLDVDAFNSCLSSGRHAATVAADVEDAVNAGARGTPHTVILLQEKAPAEMKALLESASLQLRLPPGTLGISPDARKITVSGNMPFELLEQIIQTIQK